MAEPRPETTEDHMPGSPGHKRHVKLVAEQAARDEAARNAGTINEGKGTTEAKGRRV